MPSSPITTDPDILGGRPVFTGTRVPVQALFDNLEDGLSISDFMENYPTVTHDLVISVLELAAARVRVA